MTGNGTAALSFELAAGIIRHISECTESGKQLYAAEKHVIDRGDLL